MKKLIVGGLALMWLALVGVGLDAQAAFSPSLTPRAASTVDALFLLVNLQIQQELGLSQREYASLSKKEQKHARKSVLGELESLLESAFDGKVTKKLAKAYFNALYGKPGQAVRPSIGSA